MKLLDNDIRKYYSAIELEYEAINKDISTALNLKEVKFDTLKDSWGSGFTCELEIHHKEGLVNFIITVENDLKAFDYPLEKRGPYLKLYFYYYNEFDLLLFDFSKIYPLNEYKKYFIKKWVNSTLEKFERNKEVKLLNYIFGDRSFKIYGQPETSIGSALAFEIVIKGYAETKPSKILIYKLRHYEYDGEYKVFSYAIFHSLRYFVYDYSYWSVFPAFCSPDSGTASQALNYVENLIEEINSSTEVVKKEFNISYNELKKMFLSDEKVMIQSWDDYDPFRILQSDIQEIRKDVGETKNIVISIDKNQKELKKAILENPDIIAEKLKSLQSLEEIDTNDKLTIKKILGQYIKISDIAEKSEYLIGKIPMIIKLLHLLI